MITRASESSVEQGYLAGYFSGVAAKLLSAVEVSPERSHQHEFNGSIELVRLLGQAGPDKHRYATRFLYLQEDPDQGVTDTSEMTWYDARAKSAAKTGRTEHRLYFPGNEVTRRAQEGDLLLIAVCRNGSLLAVIAEADSSIYGQLHWLFGLPDLGETGFSLRSAADFSSERLGLAASIILEQIGIDADLSDTRYLDAMLGRFGPAFPPMREFSAYARDSLRAVDPKGDPDAALMAWMDREEVLFRTLEKHLISERLREGFLQVAEPDVDGFLSYSISVQNRRKARAGAALENHLEAVLLVQHIRFERNAVTERGNRPDFLFPGAQAYRDPAFPAKRLILLAAKTTAKDRWRQVTKEGDRVERKHLLTLEPAISAKQTDQMRDSGIQLVIPSSVHGEYTKAQRDWLLDVRRFIELARRVQSSAAR
jgi:EcoRII C terminal